MRIIVTILQIIAAIFILLVPIIIVYWVLNTLAIGPLMFIPELIGILVGPLVGIVETFTGPKTIMFHGFELDLVPIYLCGILLVSSIILTVIAKVISTFRSSINFVEAKTKIHLAQRQQEAEAKEEESKLYENTVGYTVVRYKTQTTSSSYLISSGLSEKDIKNKFMEHFNRYMYLDAKLYKESTDDSMMLVFEDVPSCLTYGLQLQENVINLNKDLDKAGIKILVTCGVYCAPPQESKSQAFFIAGKVCNLAAPGDVTCSKEVKELYERDRSDHNLKYISKGMYDLGQEIEIYAVEKLF